MSNKNEWIGRYISAIQWFIPPRLQQEPVPLVRGQNVVNAALLAATCGPFFAIVYQLLGFGVAAVEILLCCLVMLMSPFLLKVSGSLMLAREVFLSALFFNFIWLTWHLGGVSAPTASWLITAPVVGMFLGGVASGLFWLVLSCVGLSAIYALGAGGMALSVGPVSDMQLLYLLCDLGLFMVVVTFALMFEMSKTQGFIKLEDGLKVISELAIRDELTGIHNRRHLLNLIETEGERSMRTGSVFCLCLFDLDLFKRVNDTYGHLAGDIVLRRIAAAVQTQTRATDSFGRYGGEEFLLVLPGASIDEAVLLAERIRSDIEKLSWTDIASDLVLTVSAGVAQYQQGEQIMHTVGRADEALYLAKSKGRNCVARYGESTSPGGAGPDLLAGRAAGQDQPASARDSAHCDPLTGMLNRHILRDRLCHAMERARRHQHLVALVMLSINKFREVNDALGHEAGDAILVQAANRVQGCLRDCDTIARWGGDEFIVLLEDIGLESSAEQVAQKIVGRFDQPFVVGARECFITLGVGVATYPALGCDVDGLLTRVDSAMESAKAWGDNKVQLYATHTSVPQCERLILKNGLREVLEHDQLFLEYQPQVEIATRRIVGVETLVRWRHPVNGRINPSRFIPLAEETGMIVQIGEWVLRTACAQSRAWSDAGLGQIKVAVNLSARQLKQPDVVARLLRIIRDSGIAPCCVDLEITEGILIENLELSRVTMTELRAAGVQVSIDDFGTGYSSLSYLSELPVDILKMDGSFVCHLDSTTAPDRWHAIAGSIIDMAHRLQLRVIAEAVETDVQLANLRAMECDEAQGFLFALPLHPDQVGTLLARQISSPAIAVPA